MSTATITPSRVLRALVLAVVTAMLALPAAAFGAPAPVAVYDVRTILTKDGSRAMLAAVEVAPDTKLPAEVSVNVPKGATIDWAGEVLGGDLAQDPTVQYTTNSGAEFDTLTFTLTKARRGQVELTYPAGTTKNGDVTKATIDYAPAQDAARLSLAVEVPSDAKVAEVPQGVTKQPVQGTSFYAKTVQNAKAGQKVQLAVDYTGGTNPQPQPAPAQGQTGAAAPQTGGSSSMSPLVAVLALGAILAGTFATLSYLGKRNGASASTEDGEEPAEAARVEHEGDDDGFFDDEPAAAPVAKPAAAKKAAPRKAAPKEPAAKKPEPKKAAAKKPAPKQAAAKSSAEGKATPRKSTARSKKTDAA